MNEKKFQIFYVMEIQTKINFCNSEYGRPVIKIVIKSQQIIKKMD